MNDLAEKFSEVLNAEIKLSFCNLLEPDGTCPYDFWSHERKKAWLRGRTCLESFNLQEKASNLSFPHPELSLSHSMEWAVAVQCKNFEGVGVDLQLGGEFKQGIEKFFLREKSNELFEVDDLRKWWTVKEACYKANPMNKGTVLNDYNVESNGVIVWKGKEGSYKFLVHSERFQSGWISVALNLGLS
jgi:phosphopantetheinyl transferase (holo-ACP synthase)